MGRGQRLSGLDSSFLHLERGPAHMHVASLLVFEGPAPAYEELVETLRARLHLVPRFRQKLRTVPFGQGRPVWIDDPAFNLEYHLRATALPPPADEQTLRTLASRLFSQRLDRGKPLWEMWLIDGLEGGRFALFGKSHHCLVDGVSGIDLTTVLLDLEQEPAERPDPEPWVPKPEPTDIELLADALVERATDPREGLRALRAALRGPRRAFEAARERALAAGSIARTGLGAPSSPFNVEIGPHRRFATVSAELALLKRIKDAQGATVNDVVLAAVSGALGRFMRAHGHSVAERELTALIPISVRTADESGDLGNRVSSMMAPLPIGLSDPVERLTHVSAQMEELKHTRQALGATLITELADFAPPTILTQAARLQPRLRLFNLVVTNVPGPQFPLYLLGRRMRAAYPMVPLAEQQAVCFGVVSYDGGVFFGIVGDFDVMAEVDALAEDLRESIAELAEATGAGPARTSLELEGGVRGGRSA